MSAVEHSQSTGLPGPGCARNVNVKVKVKTGCQTCRNRKVKCDEGRPACLRCVRTHRTCGGYGVWGGGTSIRHFRPSPTKQLQSGPVATANRDERTLLEWFRLRAATKFKGLFGSPFWDTLVLQACLEERSVFHAVMALSSVHKRVSLGIHGTQLESSLEQREQFTLVQYSKAINHLLQPHSAASGQDSVRVTLIACMLFICLEFLQGHYKTGNDHLRNGIKLLASIKGDGSDLKLGRDAANDWLIGAFTRMNLLAVQFRQGSWMPPSLCVSSGYMRLPLITFESVVHARDSLDHLLVEIIHLTGRCREKESLGAPNDFIPDPRDLDAQQRIKSDLQTWLNAYKASRVNFHAQLDDLSKIGHQLLFIFHIMANIMVDTCLRPSDQMAFDSHYRDFVSIIDRCVAFLGLVRAFHARNDPVFISGSESSLFSADIGWIPPLYYTALHCRNHHVRLGAIKLLRTVPSKEGIWDAMFAASVAWEVMRIEEGDGYRDPSMDNNYRPLDSLSPSVLPELSTPPPSARIYDVRVTLPDSPSARTVLTYRNRNSDGTCGVVSKEYDLGPQTGFSKDQWDAIDAPLKGLEGWPWASDFLEVERNTSL